MKLKEAVNAKLMLQQRKRGSYGAKRVSPIYEEDNTTMSPSLTAAFASPAETQRPLSTVSTESNDSARTVRASVPPTPAEGKPLRTPSYPFPYVPGTPRTWSSSFHQPFTNLSPTVTARRGGDQDTPGASGGIMSDESTPAASAYDFMPPGQTFQHHEDPRFPTPNLYDMVLQLNTEPGLEQWWATVTNLMHDSFKAERVTLAMPLDPTDLENVPWGQKATFSMNGREEFVPQGTVDEQLSHISRPELVFRGPSNDTLRDLQMQKLHPERLRPGLQARHSYAGPLPDRSEVTSQPGNMPPKSSARPQGPMRTMTHAVGMTSGPRHAPHRFPSTSSVGLRHTSVTDPDFSSVAGGVDAGPYAEIFSTLRSLDCEVRPLIEPGGVNRILERGKLVTVTRDYASESSGSSNGRSSTGLPDDEASTDKTPKDAPTSAAAKLFGNYRSAFAADNISGPRRDYEEYEQYPSSPWAQSPAPSPAIQADEDTNPFFPSEQRDVESSFEPAPGTPKDYSQLGQVEAIGVDRASTVIHIPLIHPSLSQPMQSLRMRPSKDRPGLPRRSNTLDLERKAPIAILSVLTSTVPYPPNLTQSMKLLGPHLATSFAIAQQFSSIYPQAISIRHRRTASGHPVSRAPMTIEPTSLEDIVNADLEDPPGSVSGSMTSPSDYSGRSRHSPTGSIVGTPGWDPASHGWTSSKSVAGTPMTGTEMVDNYFDAKKRVGQRSGSNASTSAYTTPAKPAKKLSGDGKRSARKPSPSNDSRPQSGTPAPEEKSPILPKRDNSPQRLADTSSPQRPAIRHAASHFVDQSGADVARRHSLLHSYGADFETSFGAAGAMTPGIGGHQRKSSYSEDMPPPSERLLRTIIDSVPVQIFTAKPDTGQLSWVNSKFLIYRGEEPRQVLSEPWRAIHPDDRVEFMASWHRSLRTAQQLQQKVRLQRFDGSFRWFYVRAAPLKDKRQKIVHWIGTMMDFHEQHLAELNAARQQETEASEAKYRALANSSPQIVFAVNRKRGVIFCNSQWLHFSGQTEAQALGLGFTDHVHPDDLVKCKLPSFGDGGTQATNVPTSVPPEMSRTNTASATSSSGSSETERGVTSSDSSPVSTTSSMPQRKLSELADVGIMKVSRDADGRPFYSTEVRLRSKEGEYRWHLVRVLLAESFSQQTREEETWYGTCTDINDHKTLERDLKETMDEKSRFLSNMSHEIRTPLNGIMGMVNFLIDSSLTSEQMEHVNIIRASTEGLRGLINDILDLSKAEAGMIQLNYDWLYVRALIEEVNDLTSAMAIDKGLELNYIVEEDVPAQIKGDRFRIRQILLNVIGNAIKFTQHGEVFVRCSIFTNTDQDLARNEMLIKFEIIDTGRGFTEKEADHLFKRFSQIDGSSTRQHGGTGLGLVISRQLAQLHGGDMSAKGVPGRGSTFSFFVKATLPSRHDQPPMPPPTPGVMASIPILPISPGPSESPTPGARSSKAQSVPEHTMKATPKFATEHTQSPSPYMSPSATRDSPSTSSASSGQSARSTAGTTDSLRSERSSASSYISSNAISGPTMELAIPSDAKKSESSSPASIASGRSEDTVVPNTPAADFAVTSPGGSLAPPMYSILVVCPLKYSRAATVQHIDQTLPKNIPHQITAREHLLECQKILGGDDPMRFTHVVVVLQDVAEIVALVDQIFSSPVHTSTSIVIITDLAQRKKIMEHTTTHDYEQLNKDRRLRFVFKPLKPSRFAVIFDPQKEREMSTDHNQDSAQAVAVSQKQVFDQLKKRLGNKEKRVLLVEDNRVNQMVCELFCSVCALF
jgi:PAS domain S-box-containing protein